MQLSICQKNSFAKYFRVSLAVTPGCHAWLSRLVAGAKISNVQLLCCQPRPQGLFPFLASEKTLGRGSVRGRGGFLISLSQVLIRESSFWSGHK